MNPILTGNKNKRWFPHSVYPSYIKLQLRRVCVFTAGLSCIYFGALTFKNVSYIFLQVIILLNIITGLRQIDGRNLNRDSNKLVYRICSPTVCKQARI